MGFIAPESAPDLAENWPYMSFEKDRQIEDKYISTLLVHLKNAPAYTVAFLLNSSGPKSTTTWAKSFEWPSASDPSLSFGDILEAALMVIGPARRWRRRYHRRHRRRRRRRRTFFRFTIFARARTNGGGKA